MVLGEFEFERIWLETKSGRILSLAYVTEYDLT